MIGIRRPDAVLLNICRPAVRRRYLGWSLVGSSATSSLSYLAAFVMGSVS